MQKINNRSELMTLRSRHFRISGIDYYNMPRIIESLKTKMADYGELDIRTRVIDEEDAVYRTDIAIPGHSLQGVTVVENRDNHLIEHVFLSPCSSAGDIKLLFALNEACMEYDGDAQMRWADTGKKLVNTHENYCHLLSCNLEDLDNELRYVCNRRIIPIHTLSGAYYAYLHEGDDIEANKKHTIDTMQKMVEATWQYRPGRYEILDLYVMLDHIVSVIDHTGAWWMPKSDLYILLNSKGQKKLVWSWKQIRHLFDGHPAYTAIDAVRFSLAPMPEEEWDALWRKLRRPITKHVPWVNASWNTDSPEYYWCDKIAHVLDIIK